MLTATVLIRREQFAAFNDWRGVELAKAIVRGKLGNQAALLKYFGKYLKTADPDAFPNLERVEVARRQAAPTAKVIAEPIRRRAREPALDRRQSPDAPTGTASGSLLPEDARVRHQESIAAPPTRSTRRSTTATESSMRRCGARS